MVTIVVEHLLDVRRIAHVQSQRYVTSSEYENTNTNTKSAEGKKQTPQMHPDRSLNGPPFCPCVLHRSVSIRRKKWRWRSFTNRSPEIDTWKCVTLGPSSYSHLYSGWPELGDGNPCKCVGIIQGEMERRMGLAANLALNVNPRYQYQCRFI